jgi:hypothetical protein
MESNSARALYVLAADCEKDGSVCCEIKSSAWKELLTLSILCHAQSTALRSCVAKLLVIDDRRIDFRNLSVSS